MKRLISAILASVMLLGCLVFTASAESYTDWTELPFSDVPQDAWYYEYVYSSTHLFRGTSKTTFEPDAPLTRAMLVTVLLRHREMLDLGATEKGSAEGKFSDVSDGKWYSEAVAWAAENGIVNGYPDGTFRPNVPVTREEAVTIIGRYYNKSVPKSDYYNNAYRTYFPFSDTADISEWAEGWVERAASIGAVHVEIVTGLETLADAPEYYFEPKRPMTRAEAVKVTYVFMTNLEISIIKGFDVSMEMPLHPREEGYE